MSETLRWWLMMQVVGLAALPLCFNLFRRLPDRGYSLSKPLALLLLGYLFWILNVMHILPNTTTGIWIALLLIVAASVVYILVHPYEEVTDFIREHRVLILVTEVLLFLAFITAAYLRSYVSDLGGTEKPMDFMFLNAVTRGGHFPPPDPWLSGHNISYYYFGYLITSIMTRLSGLETGVGFNLGLAMITSLAATGAFGLVYNMAASREQRAAEGGPGTPAAGFTQPPPLWRPMAFGIVAALLLVAMGNLTGILDALAAHNVGSKGFWDWVNIEGLTGYDSTRWFPDSHWFWWHSTRILDSGTGIHEFPFFSFLLGDLHPHVMSIPFVLLALGGALALLRSDEPLDLVVWLERPAWLVAYGLMLGGLAFTNTWDMPTMAFVLTLVTVLRNRLVAERWSWGLALDSAGFILPVLFVAFLAFSPFFFGGFTSQASGFSAYSGTGTGLFHALLLWGTFAVLILPYAYWRLRQSDEPITWRMVAWALAPFITVLFIWIVWAAIAGLGGSLPDAFKPNKPPTGLFDRIGERGFWNWLTAFAMGGSLALVLLALVREVDASKRTGDDRTGHIMALALATTAALLIVGAEFIHIQDDFQSRMNTIFKLYYQSWLMLSIAGAFAMYSILIEWRPAPAKEPEPVPEEAPAIDVTLAAGGLPPMQGGATAESVPDVPVGATAESVPDVPPGPTTTTVPDVPAGVSGWAPGEIVVLVATLGGALLGIYMMPQLLTRIVGAVALGGVFFFVSATAVLLLRSLAPERDARATNQILNWRIVWAGTAAVFIFASFLYPVLASYNRTNSFDVSGRSVDGMDAVKASAPGEYAAIKWLENLGGNPIVAEALGDDYTDGGRISASTGLPTLLQWPGHELQWRGTSSPQGSRADDLETLYTSSDASELTGIVQEYGINYVYLGDRERERYGDIVLPNELFEPVFEDSGVTIYQVRPGILSQNASGVR